MKNYLPSFSVSECVEFDSVIFGSQPEKKKIFHEKKHIHVLDIKPNKVLWVYDLFKNK